MSIGRDAIAIKPATTSSSGRLASSSCVQPRFELRPWVVDAEARRERLGTLLRCGLCEQESPPRSAP
jgi:hypothetical protein